MTSPSNSSMTQANHRHNSHHHHHHTRRDGGLISPPFVPRSLSFGPSPSSSQPYDDDDDDDYDTDGEQQRQQYHKREETNAVNLMIRNSNSNTSSMTKFKRGCEISNDSPQTTLSDLTSIRSTKVTHSTAGTTVTIRSSVSGSGNTKRDGREMLTSTIGSSSSGCGGGTISTTNNRKIRNPFHSPPLTARKNSKRGRGSTGSIQLESTQSHASTTTTTVVPSLMSTTSTTTTGAIPPPPTQTDVAFLNTTDGTSGSSQSSISLGDDNDDDGIHNHSSILDLGVLDTMLDEAIDGIVTTKELLDGIDTEEEGDSDNYNSNFNSDFMCSKTSTVLLDYTNELLDGIDSEGDGDSNSKSSDLSSASASASASSSSIDIRHVETILNCDSSEKKKCKRRNYNVNSTPPTHTTGGAVGAAVVTDSSSDLFLGVETELSRLEESNNSSEIPNDFSSLLSEDDLSDEGTNTNGTNGGGVVVGNSSSVRNTRQEQQLLPLQQDGDTNALGISFDLRNDNDLSLASTSTVFDRQMQYKPSPNKTKTRMKDNDISHDASTTASLNEMLERLRCSESYHQQHLGSDSDGSSGSSSSPSLESNIEEELEGFNGDLNDGTAKYVSHHYRQIVVQQTRSSSKKEERDNINADNDGDDDDDKQDSFPPSDLNITVTPPPNLERINQINAAPAISHSTGHISTSSQQNKQQQQQQHKRSTKKRWYSDCSKSDAKQQQIILRRSSSSSHSCNFVSMSQLETILNEDGEAALDEALSAPMIHHQYHQGELLLTGREHHHHQSPLTDPGAMATTSTSPLNNNNDSRAIALLKGDVDCDISSSSDPHLNTIVTNGKGWSEQSNYLEPQSPLLPSDTSPGDIISNNDGENSSEESEHDISSDRCSYSCPLHSSANTTSINNNNDNNNIRSHNSPKNTEIKYLRANLKSALIALKSVRAERRDVEIVTEGLQEEMREKEGLIDELLADLDKVEGVQQDRLNLFHRELMKYREQQHVDGMTTPMKVRNGGGGMLPIPCSAHNCSIESEHSLLLEVQELQRFVLRKDEILLDVYKQDLQLCRKRNEHLEACRLRSRREIRNLKERNKDFSRTSVALQDAMNKLAVAELELENRDCQIDEMKMKLEKATIVLHKQNRPSSCSSTVSSTQNNSSYDERGKESAVMEMELELKQSMINGHLVTIQQLESKIANFDSMIVERKDETRKLQDQLTDSTDRCKEIPNIEVRLEKALNDTRNIKLELQQTQLDLEMKDSTHTEMERKLSITELQLESSENKLTKLHKELEGSTKMSQQMATLQAELEEANSKMQEVQMRLEHKGNELTQLLRKVKEKDSDAEMKDFFLNETETKLSLVEIELESSEIKVAKLSLKWEGDEKKMTEFLGTMQAELGEAKSEVERIQKHLKKKKNEVTQLRCAVETKDLDLDEIETKLTHAEIELASSNNKVKELQGELEGTAEVIEYLGTIQDELEEANNEVRQIRLQTKDKDIEVTQLLDTVEKKDSEIEEIPAKLCLAEMELDSSDNQSKELQKKLKGSEEVTEYVETVQAKLKEANSKVERVQSHLEHKQMKTSQLLHSVENLQSNLTLLKLEVEQRESKIIRLEIELKGSKNKGEAAECEKNAYTSLKEMELTKKASEVQELSQKVNEISAQNEELLRLEGRSQEMEISLQIKAEESHKRHQLIENNLETIERLDSTVKGQDEELRKNKCYIKDLEQELYENTAQKEDTMEKCVLLESNEQRFQNELTEKLKIISDLGTESACKESQIQEIDNKSNRWQQQFLDQKNENEKLNAALNIATDKVAAVETKRVEREKVITNHLCEIDDLKLQVTNKKEYVEEIETKIEKLFKSIRILETESACKESQIQDINDKSNRWQQQLLDQGNDHEICKTALKDNEEVITTYQSTIDELRCDVKKGEVELEKKGQEIKEIQKNIKDTTLNQEKEQLHNSERQRVELRAMLDNAVEKSTALEKEANDKEGIITIYLNTIDELQSDIKEGELKLEQKDQQVEDKKRNTKNTSEITNANDMEKIVQDKAQVNSLSMEKNDELELQLRMKVELEQANTRLLEKEESMKVVEDKINDVQCSLQDSVWHVKELEEKILLEQKVNGELQFRLQGIENEIGRQTLHPEKVVNTLKHPEELPSHCNVLSDMENPNDTQSLPTRTMYSIDEDEEEHYFKSKDSDHNLFSHEVHEKIIGPKISNREYAISDDNNFDQCAYSKRISELELILLSKEDESNQAITDLITELDGVRAVSDTATKKLESTLNELQDTKEMCKQFELEIHVLELFAASTSNTTSQEENEVETNNQSNRCDEGSKVVIEELLLELDIAKKKRKESTILNQKLCTSLMTQNDSCSSLISESERADVSATHKDFTYTQDNTKEWVFEEQKVANELRMANDLAEWEADRANQVEEKLYQTISKLKEKELQLVDATGTNTCLENEVSNANRRLCTLVLCVLEQNPNSFPTSSVARTSVTQSATHSFVSHIESTDLLSLVEILESIFKSWISSKDLITSNSQIFADAESKYDDIGLQEQTEKSCHRLSSFQEKNDISLSFDSSDVGEQDLSFVKTLKTMMNKSGMVISSALEDFKIEDDIDISTTYGDESFEFNPILEEDKDNDRGIIRVDFEEYHSMRRNCEMLETERSELLEDDKDNAEGIIRVDSEEYHSMRQKCDMLETERSELLEETTILLDRSKALNDAENVAFLNEVEKNIAMERAQSENDARDRMLRVTQKMYDRYQKLNAFRLLQRRPCRCTFL